jgi:hypothetical protein
MSKQQPTTAWDFWGSSCVTFCIIAIGEVSAQFSLP